MEFHLYEIHVPFAVLIPGNSFARKEKSVVPLHIFSGFSSPQSVYSARSVKLTLLFCAKSFMGLPLTPYRRTVSAACPST